jgi:hypothetical protein
MASIDEVAPPRRMTLIVEEAGQEGHGPRVLVTHHVRSRPSAERNAAEYLGQVVHEVPGGQADSDP